MLVRFVQLVEGSVADACTTRDHDRLERRGNVIVVVRIRGCTEDVPKVGVRHTVLTCTHKRQGDGFEARAIIEGIFADARHTRGDDDAREVRAITEGTFADARHTRGDDDAREVRAVPESIRADARHTVGDGDGREARATPEGIRANACQLTVFAEGDRREARAITEGSVADARTACDHDCF